MSLKLAIDISRAVEAALVSGRSSLGMDTIAAHIEYSISRQQINISQQLNCFDIFCRL